jgi:hypothetical protein
MIQPINEGLLFSRFIENKKFGLPVPCRDIEKERVISLCLCLFPSVSVSVFLEQSECRKSIKASEQQKNQY